MAPNIIERIIHWSLLAVTAIYVISGIGITEYRTIEPLTLGLLSKNMSFTIHTNLGMPFLILLVLHVFIKPLTNAYMRFLKRV
jgi:cytochrome b561